MPTSLRFDTRAIHAGQEPEALYGAVNVPIYQTSTYAQTRSAEPKRLGLRAGREPHPRGLRGALAALEGGARGFAFGAGWRPSPRCCSRSGPGDHVILGDDVYGGTYRLLANVLARGASRTSTVDLGDLDALA